MKKTTILVSLLLCGSILRPLPLAAETKRADEPLAGVAAAPSIRASEDTPISYTGSTPLAFTGALDNDDSTYNRSFQACSGLSGVGTAVYYDTVTITNNSGASADLQISTSEVGGSCAAIDTFLAAYSPSFNPANALENCVADNDDSPPSTCSLLNLSIPDGQSAVVVITSYGNGATFDYQVNFDGTVPVELMEFTVD